MALWVGNCVCLCGNACASAAWRPQVAVCAGFHGRPGQQPRFPGGPFPNQKLCKNHIDQAKFVPSFALLSPHRLCAGANASQHFTTSGTGSGGRGAMEFKSCGKKHQKKRKSLQCGAFYPHVCLTTLFFGANHHGIESFCKSQRSSKGLFGNCTMRDAIEKVQHLAQMPRTHTSASFRAR